MTWRPARVTACRPVSKHGDSPSDEVHGTARSASRWAFPQEPYLLAFLVICFAVLARLFPLSGDDWAWGSQEGLDRLANQFDGYNGRWSGNFAILFLSRSPVVAPLVVSVTLCSIVFLLTRVSGMKNWTGYALGLALLMLMPLGTWRQTVVWLSGFANYTLATAGLLVFVWMTQRNLRGEKFRTPWLTAALTVPFAVVSATFIEHATVALVLFSVLAVIVVVRRRRTWLVQAAWAAGSVAGAAVMFSNAAYRNVASGTSTYHRVDDSGVGAIVEHATGGVSHLSVAVNLGLNVCLLVTVILLAWRARERTGRLSVGALMCVAGGLVTLTAGASVTATALTRIHWSWVSSVGLLVALVCAALFLVVDVERRLTVLALLALVVVLVAPAAVLRPYGPRNFLPSYVILAVIALILVREFVGDEARSDVKALLTAVGFVVSTVVFAGYLEVYSHVNRVDEHRLEVIRTAVEQGKRKVSVPKLPHPEHVHHSDPPNDVYVTRFKRIHGVPESMEIRFVN